MKELCHFTLKNNTTLHLEAVPVVIKENYIRIKPLKFFKTNSSLISISHSQLNTFIDLTGFESCVILYFNDDQIFEGASCFSDSSDSFYCIQTQSKNIVIAKLPVVLTLNSLLNISTPKETLNFISYEDIFSRKN